MSELTQGAFITLSVIVAVCAIVGAIVLACIWDRMDKLEKRIKQNEQEGKK